MKCTYAEVSELEQHSNLETRMRINKLLEYFEEAQGFQHIKNVICVLCGASLEIYPLESQGFNCCETKFSHPSFPPVVKPLIEYHCSMRSEQCLKDIGRVMEDATRSGEPVVTTCSMQTKRIVIPIKLRQELAGFLVVIEGKSMKLSQAQVRAIINLLTDLIADIDKNELQGYEHIRGSDVTYQRQLVQKAADFIKENYHHRDLSLKHVSNKNGISYHYLSRLFKKELKTSFSQYLNGVRMDVASRLLKDRSLSVGEIAFSCGFEDPGYFCKVFKRTFGTTPGTFRNNKRRPLLAKNYKRRFIPA